MTKVRCSLAFEVFLIYVLIPRQLGRLKRAWYIFYILCHMLDVDIFFCSALSSR